jgi:Ser/Thr protein kinase RdoA (MazF antagonist)
MNKIHTSEFTNNPLLNTSNWKETLQRYTVNGSDKIKSKFFDRDLYKKLLSIFDELVKIDLPDSYLLHGDFGRTNIFADKTEITGVIDWSECMKGDFLWDLAWIAFWPEEIDYLTEYYKYNKENVLLNLNRYQERFLLYTLVIGIHTMLIEGERDDEETYTEGMSRIKKYFPI